MHIVFVRHGESTNNVLLAKLRAEVVDKTKYDKARYDREKSHDPELSPLGKRQAARLAEWMPRYLATMNIETAQTRIMCSPMERALGTAAPIAGTLGVQCEIRSDLHETKGCWAGGGKPLQNGRTGDAILGKYGEEHFTLSAEAPLHAAGWWSNDDGTAKECETTTEAFVRAHLVAQRLRAMALSATQPTLAMIVSHGQWLSLLMQALAAPTMGLSKVRLFAHDCTGVSSVVLPGVLGMSGKAPGVNIQGVNWGYHLDEEPAIPRSASHFILKGFGGVGRRPDSWTSPRSEAEIDAANAEEARRRGATTASLVVAALLAVAACVARGSKK